MSTMPRRPVVFMLEGCAHMNPHSAVIIVAGSSAVGELQVEPHDQPEPELQPVTGLYHVVVTTGGRWSSQSIASAESA